MKTTSELRQDLVSGDWVVIATGRGKRPHDFLKQKAPPFHQSKSACPFEKVGSEQIASYSVSGGSSKAPFVFVVPNKYPAFGKGLCAVFHKVGPYQWTEGIGAHELVITEDHDRSVALFSDTETELLIHAYQDRYRALKNVECIEYVSIFHNHGRLSGATVAHPHSQIIGIPVIPPDVGRSLQGSARYFHEHKKCVHCRMLDFERAAKNRIIYENDLFIVVAPFASKLAFEIRIFPKAHQPYFELISHSERPAFANALRVVLAKLFRGLRNPDYNFFIHTAPTAGGKEFHHYHWHLEILPKTGIWAGFEMGTGIEISTIAPESAAEFLRKVKVKA